MSRRVVGSAAVRRIATLLFAILALGTAGAHIGQAQVRLSRTVIEHVTIIDMATGAARANMTVAIRGNRITDVGATGAVRVPADAQLIDATGKYLIPGLWDMHVHVLSPQRIEFFLPLLIANGVTGVRDMATELDAAAVARVRQRIVDGSLTGPRMFVAGPLLSGAQGQFTSGRIGQVWTVTSPAEAHSAVTTLVGEHVDFLKVYSYLQPEVFEAIARDARTRRVDIAGHVPIAINVIDAVRAGMRSVEHGTGLALACSSRESELRSEAVRVLATGDAARARALADGQPHESIDEAKCGEVLRRLTRSEVWQTPTIAYANSLSKAALGDPPDSALRYVPPSARKTGDGVAWSEQMRRIAAQGAGRNAAPRNLAMLRRLRQAGTRLLAGTDLGNPFLIPGASLHDELELITSAGYSPLQALRSATIEPAHFLRRERDLGSIEVGKLADVVLLDANPLADIRAVRQIRAVIADGRLFDRKALDAILAKLAAAR